MHTQGNESVHIGEFMDSHGEFVQPDLGRCTEDSSIGSKTAFDGFSAPFVKQLVQELSASDKMLLRLVAGPLQLSYFFY